MPGAHRDTLATLIAMAAVNPAGVPRPVVEQLLPGPEVMAEAAQQAKGWLGLDDTGQPRLREQDGAWRLSPDVWVDWRAFHHLAAPSAGPDDPRRIAEALAMIRGELFVGVSLPAAAQELLRPVVDEIRSVVAGAVEREIRSALAAGDADRAGRALRQGLLLLPREGSLWRLQLEL